MCIDGSYYYLFNYFWYKYSNCCNLKINIVSSNKPMEASTLDMQSTAVKPVLRDHLKIDKNKDIIDKW